MRSITIDELRNEVESYIEAAKSASGDSAVRFLNRAETALRSYDGVPERFVNTYMRLIEDLKEDLKQQIFSVERALIGKFACTVDIHNGVSGHVEVVMLLQLSNRKPDAKVRIDIDLNDYYAIKRKTKTEIQQIENSLTARDEMRAVIILL